MSRWKKDPALQNPSRDPVFDVQQAASATECTGLMPAQVENADQGENLARLQAIHRIRREEKDETESRRQS
ncbi:MAG: hypothetical protein E7324_01165 [Clostridiales bacterium]|nr:hypothetical protein [Clostridiales bacterium]